MQQRALVSPSPHHLAAGLQSERRVCPGTHLTAPQRWEELSKCLNYSDVLKKVREGAEKSITCFQGDRISNIETAAPAITSNCCHSQDPQSTVYRKGICAGPLENVFKCPPPTPVSIASIFASHGAMVE